MISTANIIACIFGVFAGVGLGFVLCSILSANNLPDDEPAETHCEGDDARLVHLIAKRYNISRADDHVALLEPETFEVAYIGTNLREVLDRSMEAARG